MSTRHVDGDDIRLDNPAAPPAAAPGRRGCHPLWTRFPAGPLAAAGAGAVAVGCVAAVDPEQGGHYPTCPFLALTGRWCPGCGGLRAVFALTRGDLNTALARNALVVIALPVLAVLWVRWLRRRLAGRPAGPVSLAVVCAAVVVVPAFGVLRNVPAGSWLAP